MIGKYIQQVKWKHIVSAAKAGVVVCAFLAFAISMREKELTRFSTIKPMFEIIESNPDKSFVLANHGGIVYFAGCVNDCGANALNDTPRQYSALFKDIKHVFKFSPSPGIGSNLTCYWRDADLNAYMLKVKLKADGWYIDGVPLVYRSEQYVTMSRKWLDAFLGYIFPREWFKEGEVPDDSTLIVR